MTFGAHGKPWCGKKNLQKKWLPAHTSSIFPLIYVYNLYLVVCFFFLPILDRIRRYDDASFRWLQRSKVSAILKVKNVQQLLFSSHRNFGEKILSLNCLCYKSRPKVAFHGISESGTKNSNNNYSQFPHLSFLFFFLNISFRQANFLHSHENKRTKEVFTLICNKVRALNKVRKVLPT